MILFRMHLLFAAFFPGTFIFILSAIHGFQQPEQADPSEKITTAYSTAPNVILMAVVLAASEFIGLALVGRPIRWVGSVQDIIERKKGAVHDPANNRSDVRDR